MKKILGLMALMAAGTNVDAMNDLVYTGSLGNRCEIENARSYTKIIVPKDTRAICTSKFMNSNVKEIVFDECKSLVAIGHMVFSECKQIESLNIPGTIQEIRESAFSYIDIKELRIGEDAEPQGFNHKFELTALKIGNYAFCACNLLTVLDIKKDVRYIGKEAFKSHNVKDINLNGVKYIGECAFLGGQSLETVSLNSCNDLEIHAGAFACSNRLKSVEISGTIKMISPDAFYTGPSTYAPIENFTIHGAENDDIRNMLIAAGIKPEVIHFI